MRPERHGLRVPRRSCCESGQGPTYVGDHRVRAVVDVLPGERETAQAEARERLMTTPVAAVVLARAVEGEPVRLDDQSVVPEIDAGDELALVADHVLDVVRRKASENQQDAESRLER